MYTFKPLWNNYLFQIKYEYGGKTYLVNVVAKNMAQAIRRLEMKYTHNLRVEHITCLKNIWEDGIESVKEDDYYIL